MTFMTLNGPNQRLGYNIFRHITVNIREVLLRSNTATTRST